VSGGDALADLGLATDLRSALRKLMTTLPDAQRPEAQRARHRVVVEPRGWMRNRDETPFLATVQQAVWQERQLRLGYRSGGSSVGRERVLDPYGLVAKGGAWYLIAAEASAGGGAPEPRMYRVSRIETAEVVAEPARRPADLDLERLWESMRDRVEERGPGVVVTLRVRAGRADLVQRMTRAQLVGPIERIDSGTIGAEPPAAARRNPFTPTDDWISFRMPFVAEGAALGVLLGFGADVEVLGPPQVRSAMAQAAAEIVGLYGRAATSGDPAQSASISTRASRSHATR
jgi:predicted DNA-binding transcriptional regulator YafY